MSLRMIEGESRKQFYEAAGTKDVFPYEQIIKSGEEGPQLMPFFTSLYNGPPYDRTTRNMAVDGSVTPVKFFLPVPSTQIWSMANFMFIIRDSKTLDAAGWGNNGGVSLANGMRVGVTINSVDYDFTPLPWINHTDLVSIGGRFELHAWGQGDDFVSLYIRVSNFVGTRVRLDGSRGDTFWMQVNDDLTYITEQRCMCNGIIEGVYLD